MDSTKSPMDAAALARQAVSQMKQSAPAPTPTAAPVAKEPPIAETAAQSQISVDELITAYFACEEAMERDVVFEALLDHSLAATQPFFEAMADRDQDPMLRLQAAGHLARSGLEVGWSLLDKQIRLAEKSEVLEEALEVMRELDPTKAFAAARAVWENPSAARRFTRVAMAAMDDLQGALAATLFLQQLPVWFDAEDPPQDLIERALLTVARENILGSSAFVAFLRAALQNTERMRLNKFVLEDLETMLEECAILMGANAELAAAPAKLGA